jgi:hypothetical protein
MMSAHRDPPAEPSVPVFPPALARVLRDRFASKRGYHAEVSDEVIVQLLTTSSCGLETHEGERNPIGVVFLGRIRPISSSRKARRLEARSSTNGRSCSSARPDPSGSASS